MDKSLIRLDTVLDPAEGSYEDQAIDFVLGLGVRKPAIARSGFYTDNRGTVVTTAEAVENCARITIHKLY